MSLDDHESDVFGFRLLFQIISSPNANPELALCFHLPDGTAALGAAELSCTSSLGEKFKCQKYMWLPEVR